MSSHFLAGRGNGFNATPDFNQSAVQTGMISGNTAFFFKPNNQRRISLQALRSNRYQFSDEFINQTSDFLSRSITSGSSEGLNNLLKSDLALDSVGVSNEIDSVVDLNRLNDYWKFIIVLNKFHNRRTAGGTEMTVIITGRCVEEPLHNNAGRVSYNPNCELVIEGKTVFQSHALNAFDSSGAKRVRTKSSRGFGYKEIVEEATPEEMYENTPGGMNYNVDVDQRTSGLSLTGDPVNRVGEYGPSQFDRRQQFSGSTLSRTLHAVNRTLREKEKNRLSPIDDYEASPLLEMDQSQNALPALVDNIRQSERSSMWSDDQFGPSINERITAVSLERDYGVTDVKVMDQQDATFWSGADQTDISARSMFESILATQIPTLMIENQIHSIGFEAEAYSDEFGNDIVNLFPHYATPSVVGVSTEEMARRVTAIRTVLESGIFRQIRQTGGDFTLHAKVNVSQTSTLALHWLDDGPADDHCHEFFPSDFALTTPLIGRKDVVRQNQQTLGHFLGQILDGSNQSFDDDFSTDVINPRIPNLSKWYASEAEESPRPRQSVGSSASIPSAPQDQFSRAFDW